jgi:hypothetical protein
LDFPGEKLVLKLWETLAEKGIGSLLSPWQLKREGRARNEVRRDELLMLAQAERDAADVRAGRKQLRRDGTLMLTSTVDPGLGHGDLPLLARVEPTQGLPDVMRSAAANVAVEQARKEINSAKAVLYAEEQLAGDSQQAPDRQVEEDWLYAWKEYAGRVAAEDLQKLWGSVLAGEIKSPGRYSIRTMEFLKTLSKAEAEVISKLARYSLDGRIVRSQMAYLESNGINFDLLLRMQELGIVSGVEGLGLNTTYKTIGIGKLLKPLISNGKALIIEHDDPEKTLQLEVYLLTEVGKQILGLGSFESDLDYLKLVGEHIAAQGFKVQLCDWRQLSETEGQYFNPVQIDA